ncbi:N-acetylglucosaminyl deacetylase, LmbE family [Paenibacillus sp. yr247]|uniref:PIG-L deacetylase family protein n=1 Tax=Paenibacillus sp. yr247 TaxID=1761880 RepID=UPI00088FC382|nr:PIG-L family deacetylase [Paenibacillus sp. yr247]SDN92101.1 N-acetylglucosaminyl deacetylase, LmbE family [Paenibacillus sp. yr247]
MTPITFKDMRGPILIVAPHPDDDVLSSGGVIQKAVRTGKPVHIIYLTNGDANTDSIRNFLHAPPIPASFRRLGRIRHLEALRVESFLGVSSNRLYFFGFPDALSLPIAKSTNENRVFRSPVTLWDRARYSFSFHRNAPYTRKTAISLFTEILNKVKPKTIIVNRADDTHPDHRAARIFLMDALRRTRMKPLILSYLIHFPKWPSFKGAFVPPARLNTRNVRALSLSALEQRKNLQAFRLYRSQFHAHDRILRLIRQKEIYWLD